MAYADLPRPDSVPDSEPSLIHAYASDLLAAVALALMFATLVTLCAVLS
jgi:hypothetical protein